MGTTLWILFIFLLRLNIVLYKIKLVRWLFSFLLTALRNCDKTLDWREQLVYYKKAVVAALSPSFRRGKKEETDEETTVVWHSLLVMEAIVLKEHLALPIHKDSIRLFSRSGFFCSFSVRSFRISLYHPEGHERADPIPRRLLSQEVQQVLEKLWNIMPHE